MRNAAQTSGGKSQGKRKAEELEKQLLSIQVKEKQKESDDELDIEDDDTPKPSNLPDIRITKKKGKGKATLLLQETLKGIKDREDEILRLKEEVRKSQLKVKAKDKEIFRLRNRIKKYSSSTHTAYNI